MPVWSIEHTERTNATPERIWAWYEDTASAPSWDPLVGAIRPNGPLAAGTTGTNRAPGPLPLTFPFTYTEVTPLRSYTEVTRLPLAALSFGHRLTPTETGCTVTHDCVATGLLAPLYGVLLRRQYRRGLPLALRNLVSLAEKGPPPATR